MARLDHPNIVQFLDVDQDDNNFFYAMEYVLGTDLRRLVRSTGPLPVPIAASFTRQVALGLQHAHERNLVHRDIKPANLYLTKAKNADDMLGDDYLIKILDWGLSSLRPPGHNVEQQVPAPYILGTIDFMSPEQALNPQAASVRSDIYSLGCSLYYLLTGQPPFAEGTIPDKLLEHQHKEPAPLTSYRDDVPSAFSALLGRMLAKRPDDAFRTPDALTLALAPYARQADEVSGINYDELVRASRLRGNDNPSAWTFGSLSASTASRHTLFSSSETHLRPERIPRSLNIGS